MNGHQRYFNQEKKKALHIEVLRILASQQSVLLKAAEIERVIEREKLIISYDGGQANGCGAN
jgi:hypothetical protein